MSKDDKLTALSQLSRRPATLDDLKAYWEEVTQEKNDRGAAILMATHVEMDLRDCIQNRLHVPNTSRLFGHEAPMGTFENKIRMAVALEIIGNQTAKTLNLVKAVRNAFA